MGKFRGTGGEPPSYGGGKGGGGGGGSKWRVKGHRFFEPTQGKYPKKVQMFRLDKGERGHFVTLLDNHPDYAFRVHKGFFYDGTFENYVPCSSASDPKGCPLCQFFDEKNKAEGKSSSYPYSWHVVLTLISHREWEVPDGKNKGTKYNDFRKLVLLPKDDVKTFEEEAEHYGGLRLLQFEVGRSDKPMSPRIGDSWKPRGKIKEGDLIDKVEEAAERYGVTPELYIEPIDYEKVLALWPYEKLEELRRELAADRGPAMVGASSPKSLEDDDETDMEDLPF